MPVVKAVGLCVAPLEPGAASQRHAERVHEAMRVAVLQCAAEGFLDNDEIVRARIAAARDALEG